MHVFGGKDSPPPVEGFFVSRPNRFIVIAETGGREVRAHCPNPGRMWELLHPGRKLLLVPSTDKARKTHYSLAAAVYRDKIIPMNASLSNKIAEELILPILFPKMENLRREYTITVPTEPEQALPEPTRDLKKRNPGTGRKKPKSRFDFCLESEGKKHLIEVKSCSLSEEGVAMFPDAPTERGKRHIEELMELQSSGKYECHIIIVIHHRDAKIFIPNFHTDPDFSLTMEKASELIGIHAVSVETDRNGRVNLVNPEIPVDLSGLDALRKNRGFFMVFYNIKYTEQETESINTGKFESCWYILLEETREELGKTMTKRIQRKNETGSLPERLNYHASERKGIPVYCIENCFKEAKENLIKIGDRIREQETENRSLFRFSSNPLTNPDFTAFLFYFRHKRALETLSGD